METDAHSRALLNVSFGDSSRGVLAAGPPHRVPSEGDAPLSECYFIMFTNSHDSTYVSYKI